jgi:hypothetical protein
MNFGFVCLAVMAVCFQSINGLSLPAKYQDKLTEITGKDGKECTKKMIEMISKAESVDLGDFHEKSDIDKVMALWGEMRTMLRNGNNFTKHFEGAIAENYGKKGDNLFKKKFEEFLEDSEESEENKVEEKDKKDDSDDDEDEVASCVAVKVFPAMYDMMYESEKSGRFGDVKKYMAMVKDMMTSVDPEKEDITDSNLAGVAYFSMLIGIVPDFVLSAVTVLVYIPEHVLEQFIDEFPKALATFNPEPYMRVFKEHFGNLLESAEEKL